MQNINNLKQQIISLCEEYTNLAKIQKEKHTIFWWENSAILYIKQNKQEVVIGFHKGYLMTNSFDFLETKAKYIRHLHFKKLAKDEKQLLKQVIDKSISHAIELKELQKMKCNSKKQNHS